MLLATKSTIAPIKYHNYDKKVQTVCIFLGPYSITSQSADQYMEHVICPNSKVHGANMGPIWGRQDPGGSHVGPINFVIWDPALRIWIPLGSVFYLKFFEHPSFGQVAHEIYPSEWKVHSSEISKTTMYCWCMFLMAVATDLTHVTILI